MRTPRYIRVLLFVLVSIAGVAATMPTRAEPPGPATTPPAMTRPATAGATATTRATVWAEPRPPTPEIAALRRMIAAGDARVIPTLLNWLAAEQDVEPPGNGTTRLREVMLGLDAMRVREAMPLLVAISDDNGRGGYGIGGSAALTGMRIDPGYSPEWLREFVSIEPAGRATPLSWLSGWAAGQLVDTLHDADARKFLLDGVKTCIDTHTIGIFLTIVAGVDDGPLRDRLLALAPRREEGPVPTAAMIRVLAEQVRVNGLTGEELIRLCEDALTPDTTRFAALKALARRGEPGHVSRVERLPVMRVPREMILFSSGIVTPATVADAIRARHHTGRAAEEVPKPELPTPLPPDAPEPADPETAMRAGGISRVSNRGDRLRVALTPLDAGATTISAEITADDAETVKTTGTGDLVLVRLTPDHKAVRSIRPYEARPGEAAANTYVLLDRRTVRDGAAERAALVLWKLGRQVVARIPNRTGPGGEVVPDSALTRAAEQLRSGDLVEARLETVKDVTLLTWIGPYRPSMPARFVRRVDVPQGDRTAPGVELSFGRHLRTFVLPAAAGGRRPALDEATLAALPKGWAVRFTTEGDVFDAGATAQVLRDLRVSGYVVVEPVTGVLTVRSGRTSWSGRGALFQGGVRPDAYNLRYSISRLFYRAGETYGFDEKAMSALRPIWREFERPWRPPTPELNGLAQAWREAGDPAARETVEQRMFLAVQGLGAAADQREDDFVGKVKAALSPEQYARLHDVAAGVLLPSGERRQAGGPWPMTRPVTRPGPATRP